MKTMCLRLFPMKTKHNIGSATAPGILCILTASLIFLNLYHTTEERFLQPWCLLPAYVVTGHKPWLIVQANQESVRQPLVGSLAIKFRPFLLHQGQITAVNSHSALLDVCKPVLGEDRKMPTPPQAPSFLTQGKDLGKFATWSGRMCASEKSIMFEWWELRNSQGKPMYPEHQIHDWTQKNGLVSYMQVVTTSD